jgi:hypothetical protein
MSTQKNFFVVTHQDLPWQLPFEHQLVGVEGYAPDPAKGISASLVISRLLDSETAFGGMRSAMAMNEVLAKQDESAQVFMGSYRLFLGQETSEDWLSPLMQENRVISPQELQEDWSQIIATEIPDNVDIMIPAPRLLPDTVLGQYARVHHLDDLMLALGCAIRAGLLDPLTVPAMLTTNTLIPYGIFAARKSIRYEFNRKLWACALDFYRNHYVPRTGYQRRIIDFVFERVSSMAVMQMVMREQLRCVSCRNIFISADGNYKQSS